MDPKKVLELKLQQEMTTQKMYKHKSNFEKCKNKIAEISSKIFEEEEKREFRISS